MFGTKQGRIATVFIVCLVAIVVAWYVGNVPMAIFFSGLLVTMLGVGGRMTVRTEFFTAVAGAGVMLMVLSYVLPALLKCGIP